MTIEFKDGRYFSCVWFCSQPDGRADYFAALYRDPGGPWVLTYRFRYAAGEYEGNAEELRNWFQAESRNDEAESIRGIDAMSGLVAARYDAPLHKVYLKTDVEEEMFERMRGESWFHFTEEEGRVVSDARLLP
jgi:hypothetical protein